MKKVIFICLGNICRSPAAEAIFNKMVSAKGDFLIPYSDSAGLHDYHSGEHADRRMRSHAFLRGYNITSLSRKISKEDFYNFDLIIGMDDRNIQDLKKLAPDLESSAKIHRMSEYLSTHTYDHIPDPYYGGAEGFELVLDLLEDACSGLLEVISSDRDN